MRRLLLFAMAAAAVLGACGSAASSTAPDARTAPDHHQATYPPERHQPTNAPEQPAATPYDGVTYQDPGTNPFVDPARDRESTFALDVDTASYTIARRYVADGNLPDPSSVRVEEFVNTFAQDYPAPEDGAFSISADGGPSPFLARDEVLLRIGVQARDVTARERPDAALTFVVDVSGSMAREDRLGLVKQALTLLVAGLHQRDTVAIVAFGSDARVVLEPTPARSTAAVLAAIDSLQPEGSTNAEAGLRLGYQLAAAHLLEGGINRVVLASDGVANMGSVDADSILARIRPDANLGIQLVTVGFGMGNYDDALMEQLADKGDGFYAYVDQLDEARRVFVDELPSTLQTVALDARAQVDFDPSAVEAYRLVGYENRALPDASFRDDTVDAGAIGAGHASTALYALRLTNEGEDARLGTVYLRWTDPETRRATEITRDLRASDLSASFEVTSPVFRLDAIVAATAERLRASRWGDTYDLRDVADVAREASLPQTDQVRDFLAMLDAVSTLER